MTVVVVVLSTFLSVGIVDAATGRNITKSLGGVAGEIFNLDGTLIVKSLNVLGVTHLNGTIVHSGKDKPVTIGDDLRVEGVLFRGAVPGSSDNKPVVVNDGMRIKGNLAVEGDIKYDNAASGLSATTVEGAIDEMGVGLSELLLKKGEVAEGTLPTTTWKGHRYSYGTAADPALESTEITLTFTPTGANNGTFISTPLYAFDVNGSSNGCGASGTFNGNYEIVENMMFAYVTSSAANPNCTSSIVATSSFTVQGKTVHFVNNRTIPNDINIYTRQ